MSILSLTRTWSPLTLVLFPSRAMAVTRLLSSKGHSSSSSGSSAQPTSIYPFTSANPSLTSKYLPSVIIPLFGSEPYRSVTPVPVLSSQFSNIYFFCAKYLQAILQYVAYNPFFFLTALRI